jgi:precorrin isomerase
MSPARPARTYTAAEVDAAIAALEAPERLAHATEVVTHAAPGLQRMLEAALAEGGWFGSAHEAELQRVAAIADAPERLAAVRTLVDEQTRVGMLVGVAVGFELARELEARSAASQPESHPQED